MSWNVFSRTKLIFLCLVALAFSLRASYFNQTAQFIQPGIGSDAYEYLQWAKDIVRGNIVGKDVFYALPGYPYFLSLSYILSGGETFGLILIQILIGAVNCGLIYILGKRLYNNQVGIIAAIIACGYIMFIFYDHMLLPTSLAIFLGLLFALVLIKAKAKPSLTKWFGAGLLLGLCALTRPRYSLLAIFIVFWIFSEYKKRSLRQLLLYCLCFSLSFLFTVTGTIFRNYLVAGDPAVITAHGGINFYIGNNPRSDGLWKAPPYMRPLQSSLLEDSQIIAEKISGKRLKASEASNFWLRRSLEFIKSQPLTYIRLLGKKVALFWNGTEHLHDIEYYIFDQKIGFLKFFAFKFSLICPLALLGIFISWPFRERIMLLYGFVFFLMLGTIIFFTSSRYRLIVAPYLIIFAAGAFWQTLEMAKNRRYKNFILRLALILTLYFLTNTKVAAVASPNFAFHYNQGIYLSNQGDYQEAEQEFQEAIKLNPHDYMTYLALGNLYYRMKDFPQAIDNYERALDINPYFYNAHFNLGILYEEMGRQQQAQEQFNKVLELKPQDFAAHYNLGRIYKQQGLVVQALKEYEQALKIKPGHWEIIQAIAEIKGNKENEK